MAPKNIDVTLRGKDETKAAFDSAHKNAEDFGSRVKESLNQPFEIIKHLFAIELVKVVGEFFKASVEAAAESEAAWTRVGQAVENAGIAFSGVRGELKETFEQISDRTRFSEKKISDAFATVLNISNNYAGSLKNLPLITNIAIAKQVDLSTAATIVGKAMEGQTALLKRYGIIIKDGADAMEELGKRFSGFAERDGASLEGRIHKISNEWEEFQIQVGLAITGTNSANDAAGKLVTTLQQMSKWVETNRVGFREWSRDFSSGLKEISEAAKNTPLAKFLNSDRNVVGYSLNRVLGRSKIDDYADKVGLSFDSYVDHSGEKDPAYQAALAKERARAKALTEEQVAENTRVANAEKAKRDAETADKALAKRIADLKTEGESLFHLMELSDLSEQDTEKLNELNRQLVRIYEDQSAPLKLRAAAGELLKKQTDGWAEGLKKWSEADQKFAELAKKGVSLGTLKGEGANALLEGPDHTGTQAAGQINFRATASALPSTSPQDGSWRGGEAKKALDDLEKSGRSLGETMNDVRDNSIAPMFEAWGAAIPDIIAGHEKLGDAILKSARRAIGGSMVSEGQQALYKAALASVAGFSNPAEFARAARYLAIGSAEIAAGAALMSGGGGGGGGGYGGGGGVSPSGFSQLSNQNGGPGSPPKVVINGKYAQFDFRDPVQRDEFKQFWAAMYGNREIDFVFTGV